MISVCMATYNGEKYIAEQLESILQQLDTYDEIIISDDGSSDNTIDIIKSFNDSRIHLFYNNSHNYSKNFENALIHSKGEYIFLSDQDDVWEANKLSEVMKCFNSCKSDLVITDAEVVDESLNTIEKSYFNLCNVKKGFWHNLIKTRYIGACMAFKREILQDVLPIPVSIIGMGHDYWITVICEKKYNTSLLNISLMKYRRHSANTSSGVLGKSKLTTSQKITKRIATLKELHRRGI